MNSKEYNKNYYEKNKEKIREHREKNREERLETYKKYYQKNIEKIKDYRQAYYISNKKHLNQYNKTCFKKHHLKRKYGITQLYFDNMLSEQNHTCAICHSINISGKALAVDHDHSTGTIRGLLCYRCNMLLGYAKDNIKTLGNAIKYLRRHSV